MLFPKTDSGELEGQLWRTRRNAEIPQGINRSGENSFQFNILPRNKIHFHLAKRLSCLPLPRKAIRRWWPLHFVYYDFCNYKSLGVLCMRDEEQWDDVNWWKERPAQDSSFHKHFRRHADNLDALCNLHFPWCKNWQSGLLVSHPIQSSWQQKIKTKGKLVLPVCLITSESPFQILFISTLMDASFSLTLHPSFCFPVSLTE